MSERYGFRMTKELKDAIEKDAKQGSFPSMNEWLTEAAKHFLECKKAYQTSSMRLIVLKYSGYCLNPKCKRKVDVGEWAYYGRGVGIICLDCFIERLGDKTVIAKYMKMRELKHSIKVFQAELDNLADKLDIYATADKLDQLHKEAVELKKFCMRYLKEAIGRPEEQKALEDVIRATNDMVAILRAMEEFFEKRLKRKIKKAPYET